MGTTRPPAAIAAAALTSTLLTAPLWAQAPPPSSSAAATPRAVTAATLCGPVPFAPPAATIARLQVVMSRADVRRNIATVLTRAGLEGLTARVEEALTGALVQEMAVPANAVIPWMARRSPRVEAAGPVQWTGPSPLEGFAFTVDDLTHLYTFFIPKRCATLALLRDEPSAEAARRAALARAADAQRREEDEQQARIDAFERERAELKARRDEEMRQLSERAKVDAAQAEREEQAALEAQRARERELVAAALRQERAADTRSGGTRFGTFVAPFAGALATPSWTGLAGVKGGVVVPLGRVWMVKPALQVDTAFGERRGAQIGVDAELRLAVLPRLSIGGGVAVTDVGHPDRTRGGWLATLVSPLGQPAGRHALGVFVEGRRSFPRDRVDDSGARAVAGLEIQFK